MSLMLASMLVTATGGPSGVALTSTPVVDMSTCRKNMVSYIDDFPDMSVFRKGEDFIVGKVSGTGGIITFYVKCQIRDSKW